MAANAIKTVGIVSTGVIGSSWTSLFLARGLNVIVSDPGQGAEEHLRKRIDDFWPSLEKLGLSPGASKSNMHFVGKAMQKDHYESLDFVQESAPEMVELKSKIMAEIDAATRADVIIASSSSGLPSSTFVKDCKKNPARVLIGHPFNPPHLMPLVEVVPHPGTDKQYGQRALEFYKSLGKSPILVNQETPGFIANRLQAAVFSEAHALVQRGIVSAEEVDTVMSTSLGPRWALAGPFMSNVLAGGGDFRHLIHHLGPAMQNWIKDMADHPPKWDEESIEQLGKSVDQLTAHHDPDMVEKERDEIMIKILQAKSKTSALV